MFHLPASLPAKGYDPPPNLFILGRMGLQLWL